MILGLIMNYDRLTKKELISLITDLKKNSYDNSIDLFISNISHDVRTLLNSIYGHTQVLSKDESLNKNHQDLINKILDASSHMIDLINEIINISKNVGSGKLNLCTFDLNTLVENIYSIFESIALSKGIKIILNNNIPKGFIIKSDKNKLFYILLNIIGNAIKFTAKGSVTLNCQKNENNSILFEIIDTGIGIEQSLQKEILQSYVRVEENSGYEGNGLGLAIANKNIKALGSELQISSTKNQGSTFSFVISCESSREDILNLNKEVFALKKIKRLKKGHELFILIGEKIDKEKSILEAYLKSKKINYAIFDTEKELLNYLQTNTVDLIFLDTNLGRNNSFELVKEIRKSNITIPIIALTASAMSDEIRTVSQNFTNYIIKPYSFSNIDQSLIFFTNTQFEFEEESDENESIFIDNEVLKNDILEYAKLGQYKKLSELIEKVTPKNSKELLTIHLNNYNFDEIINKIEMTRP